MKVSLVVAHSENRVIGRGGQMPWHLPADLAHFKRVTMGKPMVMGRRTFEAIGRALPGRRSIVVTRDTGWSAPGVEVAHSVEEALAMAGDAREITVIGGGQLYEAVLDRAQVILLTLVHASLEGDTFFPELDPDEWREVSRERRPADAQNPYDLSFIELQRQ